MPGRTRSAGGLDRAFIEDALSLCVSLEISVDELFVRALQHGDGELARCVLELCVEIRMLHDILIDYHAHRQGQGW